MVFGELLGGMLIRGGERFQEKAARQRKLEDWQRQQDLNFTTDFMTKNWADMLPEQQRAMSDRYAKLVNISPKDMNAYITQAQAIHSIIPPQYAPPELGEARTEQAVAGETQPAMPGAVSPAFRTQGGRQMEATAAPAMPEISIGQIPQIPQPSETGTPSIFARTTGHEAVSEPRQMTPNEILEQRKLESANLQRQQSLQEIDVAPIPDYLKQAARSRLYNVNTVPIITSEIGAQSRENMTEKRAGEFRGSGRLVMRDGLPLPVKTIGRDELILENGQWVPYVPAQGDEPYEKKIPLSTVTGAKDVYSYNRKTGKTEPLKIGVQPRASTGAATSRDFRDVMSLRKDFENHPITKQADETTRQVKLAEGAMTSGSSNYVAIDQALINVFNKMIDPNSVVREGEYARTIENTALLNRIKGKVSAIVAGGAGLTDEERQALISLSKSFAADSQAAYTARSTEFQRMAAERGWNPDDVVVTRAGPTSALKDSDYGPVENATLDGKPAKVRKNLKTGKYRRVN